ncbi:MAG: hypothetical protein P4L71_08515 [Acetobacteraceae bacterium]|nr:hypothetical protein [Acetobacteraceae bacterium]
MGDAWHEWGTDLSTGPKGDLAVADDQTLGQQRILRRLLTNPGDYIWHLDYGGGLGAFVGQPAAASQIASVVRAQMFLESSVARDPEPEVVVDTSGFAGSGSIFVKIQYTDAEQGDTQVLQFSLPGNST